MEKIYTKGAKFTHPINGPKMEQPVYIDHKPDLSNLSNELFHTVVYLLLDMMSLTQFLCFNFIIAAIYILNWNLLNLVSTFTHTPTDRIYKWTKYSITWL